MEKIVSLLIFITILSSSCANRKKTNDNDYCEIIRSIKIDSLGNFNASWRGEVIRLEIYTKKDTIGCILKKQQSDNKIILRYKDSWLPIDSIRGKEDSILNGTMINQIKYCFKLMDENKYQIHSISRNLQHNIRIISTNITDIFYIPDSEISNDYIRNNNLRNTYGKWWIRIIE